MGLAAVFSFVFWVVRLIWISSMRYFLALGTNVGDLEENMKGAVRLIGEGVGRVVKVSQWWRNAAVGFVSDHEFLNGVVEVESVLEPLEVLAATQEVERRMGRRSKTGAEGYADRVMDVDVLAAEGAMPWKEGELVLPHARFAEREFVLRPWAEIAPDFRLPCGNCVEDYWLGLKGRMTWAYVPRREDLEVLNGLLYELTGREDVMDVQGLERIAEAQGTRMFVGRNGVGRVVAMVAMAVEVLPSGTKVWMEDLVVAREERGRGWGRALLERVEREAIRAKAVSVNLTSRPERGAANRLYVERGYRRRNTNVYRKVCGVDRMG